jgi:Flp pilus assembly protein TadD
MLRRYILALILAAAVLCGAREPRWIRIHSAHFEIYSTASERSTRETLAHFQQVRSFFLQTLARSLTARPVFLVLFGTKKEYEPYRFNEFATAYYHATADRDYIVLSETGPGVFPVAVHEYVHLVIRHLNLHLPPWMNEGLAEFYSTLKPQSDRILIGSLIEGRYQSLFREPWIPLDTILAVNQESPYYNEKDQAGGFYNESWVLTHMLMMSDFYHAKIDQFLLALNEGQPSGEAFRRVYGKPTAAVERDLMEYLRGGVFRGAILPAKLEKGGGAQPVEVANSFDVRLLLAHLMSRPGNESEARRAFEALAAEDPKRPEPYAELGYLAWRGRNNEDARQFFRKAFDLGDRSPGMLWDYGRLSGTDFTEAARVLSALLEQQPDRVEARLALAQAELMGRNAAAALAAVAPIHEVARTDSAQLFRIIAYAQRMLGNPVEARNAGERWQKEARGPGDRAQAARFLAQLEPGSLQSPFIEGMFVRLECEGGRTQMVLREGQAERTLLIEDPAKVRIIHRNSGATNFACGPQEPAWQVRVEYDPPSRGASDGIVRSIEFR